MFNFGGGDAAGHWNFLVVIGAAVLGVVLIFGLLNLLENRRARGFVAVFLVLPVLLLGFLAMTALVVRSRIGAEREDETRRQAEAAMLQSGVRQPALPGPGDVMVVLSPPDKAEAGKTPDDSISVKIHQDDGSGKGTIIYVKANRMLESLGKAFLDTIRHGTEKETEPEKPSPTPTAQAAVSPSGPAAPPAKAAAGPPSKPPTTPAVKQDPIREAIQVIESLSKSAAGVGATRKTSPRTAAKPRAPANNLASQSEVVYEETVTAYGKDATDSQAALDDELQLALARYMEGRFGPEAADQIEIPADDLRKCVALEPKETVELKGLGPMVRTTGVVRFNKAFQARIDQEWAKVHLSEKFWYLGGGLGAVMLLLAVGYGYLKIDLATHGAYRWRLRLAAIAIVVGIAAGIAVGY